MHLVNKNCSTALFQTLFSLNSYVYVFWVCTPPCVRKLCIWHVWWAIKCLISGHFFNMFNLKFALRWLHGCLAYENFPFCKLNNVYFLALFQSKCMMGGCTTPCVRKFYNWWAKDAKFQAFFSLNVYDFLADERGQPPCFLLIKFCIWWYQNA